MSGNVQLYTKSWLWWQEGKWYRFKNGNLLFIQQVIWNHQLSKIYPYLWVLKLSKCIVRTKRNCCGKNSGLCLPVDVRSFRSYFIKRKNGYFTIPGWVVGGNDNTLISIRGVINPEDIGKITGSLNLGVKTK